MGMPQLPPKVLNFMRMWQLELFLTVCTECKEWEPTLKTTQFCDEMTNHHLREEPTIQEPYSQTICLKFEEKI